MDSYSSFSHRIGTAIPFLGFWFVVGFVIVAVWQPGPLLILTVALGITLGMLLLGPYAAAILYLLRLQWIFGGYLRVPVCAIMASTSVFIVDSLVVWSTTELAIACVVVVCGAILGHDGALAALQVRASGEQRADYAMMLLFPVATGLAALAGYCSLGFGTGSYRLLLTAFT